jgi:hypothetical protein
MKVDSKLFRDFRCKSPEFMLGESLESKVSATRTLLMGEISRCGPFLILKTVILLRLENEGSAP